MDNFFKLIFYVPKSDLDSVKSAIFETGAGRIGNYSHCSWEVLGFGQFRPLQGANPSIGMVNKVEKVEEYRVEVLCTEKVIHKAIKALRKSHPYEEPAFEVVKIESQFIDHQ